MNNAKNWYLGIKSQKLNEVEGKENYQVKPSQRFTVLENWYDVDISRTCAISRQRKVDLVIMNWSSVSHGSTKDIQNN
jgi:hypothetical protein